ncbi:MAG: hypothetical protein ACI86H_000940 [bacterium]|jgi:hypothetical protein
MINFFTRVFKSKTFQIIIKITASLASAVAVIGGFLFLYNSTTGNKIQLDENDDEGDIVDELEEEDELEKEQD